VSKIYQGINYQVWMNFLQICSKQDIIHHVVRSKILLIPFGIKENCHLENEYIILSIYKKDDKIDYIEYFYFSQLTPVVLVIKMSMCITR
jgi:hypothetical protein